MSVAGSALLRAGSGQMAVAKGCIAYKAILAQEETQGVITKLNSAQFQHDLLKGYRDAMIISEGYRQLANRSGKPFSTFRAFCVEKQPWGSGTILTPSTH